MSAGFSNFLPDGQNIQIDENYSNLVLHHVFSLSASTQVTIGNPNVYQTTLTVANLVNPVVVLSSTGAVALVETNRSGSSTTYTFCTYSTGTVFKVYIFDDAFGEGNCGMQVFDSAGKLVFDSSRKYLRIISSFSFTTYAGAGNITIPVDGRTYGWVVSGFLGYFEDYWDAYETGDMFSVKSKGSWFFARSGGSLVRSRQQYWVSARSGIGNTNSFSYEVNTGTVQIVDLTGY